MNAAINDFHFVSFYYSGRVTCISITRTPHCVFPAIAISSSSTRPLARVRHHQFLRLEEYLCTGHHIISMIHRNRTLIYKAPIQSELNVSMRCCLWTFHLEKFYLFSRITASITRWSTYDNGLGSAVLSSTSRWIVFIIKLYATVTVLTYRNKIQSA